MASFQSRVVGAMQLKAASFEEVEHDTAATGQAALVVVLASVSSGIAFLWYGGAWSVFGSAVWALVSWMVFAGLVWIVGTRIIPGRTTQADLGQLLRTMGFAQAPGLLAFLGVIPLLGWPIWLAIFLWTVTATVVAVRQALDYEHTARAVAAVVLAIVLAIVLTSIVALATSRVVASQPR